jgi:hypothetical protein
MKTTKIFLILFCLFQANSYAFRPLGHVMLKDRIVASLAADNKFRIAMEKYPHIAAWGAVGPDLGYNVDISRIGRPRFKRQIKNSMLVADIAHYHAVGTFTTKLIEEAEARNDEKFYAFVGGWITHIAGDFASHSILVKPEAGYYISCEEYRDLHGDLENLADYLLYKKYAAAYSLPSDLNYDSYWPVFFGISADPSGAVAKEKKLTALKEMLGGTVNTYFLKVYRETYELEGAEVDLVGLASTYSRAVGVGLGKVFGFGYDPEKLEVMRAADATRETRVYDAFAHGLSNGTLFLNRAVTNDRAFSDSWNLDIGENGEPTYVIRIDASKKLSARTKNDVFATFIHRDGSKTPVRLNTRLKKVDFIFYQGDSYYYALNLGGKKGEITGWTPDNITSVELSLRPGAYKGEDPFRIKRATIYYNGKAIATQKETADDTPLELTKSAPITFLIKT